jgi:hypothetical protein
MGADDAERGTDLKRALRRAGVSMRCPACDWTLEGPLGEYVLAPRNDEAAEDLLGVAPAGIPLMVFACVNCGYVRLHSANVVARAAAGELPGSSG